MTTLRPLKRLTSSVAIFLFVGLIALFSAIPQILYTSELAWWLKVRFQPSETEIEGLRVSDIDPQWKTASVLRDALLPPEAFEPGESIKEIATHCAFFQILDLDSDGIMEKVVVGVYSTSKMETGRFLLILGEKPDGRWQKKALFKDPGNPGFSVLCYFDGKLTWSDCIECDVFSYVLPSQGGFKLQYYHGPD